MMTKTVPRGRNESFLLHLHKCNKSVGNLCIIIVVVIIIIIIII